MVRRTVHFSGRVQGVGFRYTALDIAAGYDVAGYVQNLPDGRVRLVAEGQQTQVEALIEDLKRQMGRYIAECLVQPSNATGEFGKPGVNSLTIRYGV